MAGQRRLRRAERGRLEQRLHMEWLLTVSALLLLTFLLSYFGAYVGLNRFDHLLYGRTMSLATHEPSDKIIIVALDDSSLREMGYWPWRRSSHAQLLDRLSTSKVVGLDLMLGDSNPAYPDDDRTLAQAMSRHGRVVLPLVLDHGSIERPLPILADAAAALGFINVQLDSDSVVRSMALTQSVAGARFDHFVVAMMEAGGAKAQAAQLRHSNQTTRLISYAGDPGSFTMFPYARVLDGSVPASVFDGKYVLVGAWAAALGDTLSVPLSKTGEPMAGVEILANGLQNALGDYWITTPNRLHTALLSMVPMLLVCLAMRRLSPRRSFFVVVGIVACIFFLNWLLMRYAAIWVAPASALVGIILAQPIWSWRSQEATLRHVDQEIDQLYGENLLRAPSLAHEGGMTEGSSLPARMVKLHQAMGLLRRAINQREETLRFLSHDMRSPQNAILALTQLQRYSKAPLTQPELLDRVDRSANRTLALVDGFVRLARAESMALDLREVDLGDLLRSVCDERWPMAQRRKINVAVNAPEGGVYVMADSELLGRALGNLVDNAIHYSPDGSHVLCRLYQQGVDWVVAVQDKGRGLTQEQQAGLFEPFRRFDVDAPGNPDGSGLGLALVRAVAIRHAARLEVNSTPGQGSVFRVIFSAR